MQSRWGCSAHAICSKPFVRFSIVSVAARERGCRYGFVEFKNEEDADYAIKIMNMIRRQLLPAAFLLSTARSHDDPEAW